MTPTVSILILTCNRVDLSQECIPKILENIGKVDCEILIWDNCSNDGTYDWLEDYKYTDTRIKSVFSNDVNIGVEAINFLAEQATGEYIIKVDDDVCPPENFANRMIDAYKYANEPKILFLSWDMGWRGKTFATRSGMKLYNEPRGRIINTPEGRVLISLHPDRWMVNGVLRLSKREDFLKHGRHPIGVIYGVDHVVSKQAAKAGFYVGFLNNDDLVVHLGGKDTVEMRKLKDSELNRTNSPRHV